MNENEFYDTATSTYDSSSRSMVPLTISTQQQYETALMQYPTILNYNELYYSDTALNKKDSKKNVDSTDVFLNTNVKKKELDNTMNNGDQTVYTIDPISFVEIKKENKMETEKAEKNKFDWFKPSTCEKDCNGHGKCIERMCQCDPSYIGKTCSKRMPPYPNGESIPPLYGHTAVPIDNGHAVLIFGGKGFYNFFFNSSTSFAV
jgi:hypothetical protein